MNALITPYAPEGIQRAYRENPIFRNVVTKCYIEGKGYKDMLEEAVSALAMQIEFKDKELLRYARRYGVISE